MTSLIGSVAFAWLVCVGSVFSQNNVVCFSCGEKITGSYMEVDGKYFHPAHFLCDKCQQPITGSYQKKGTAYYHPECYAVKEGLICSVCNQPLTSDYVNMGGKLYHPECYKDKAALRCAICGEPLLGAYTINIYNDAYHPHHTDELEKCDNCGRLICPRLTHGGQKLSDGRAICNICYPKSILSSGELDNLLSKVLSRLRSMNIILSREAVSIKAVDRNTLMQFYEKQGPIDELRGFCKSESQEKYLNNVLAKRITQHTIYVLNGVPALDVEGILAHELFHAWMYENVKQSFSPQIVEGSCNFIAYLYMGYVADPEAKIIRRRLVENEDPVYGKGFRDIKSRFEGKSVEALLNYLKK